MWPASTMLDSSEQSPSALKYELYVVLQMPTMLDSLEQVPQP